MAKKTECAECGGPLVKGECAECAGEMESIFSLKDLVVEARKRVRKEADTWNPSSSFTGGHGSHAAHHTPHAKCPPGQVRHKTGGCVSLRGGHRA